LIVQQHYFSDLHPTEILDLSEILVLSVYRLQNKLRILRLVTADTPRNALNLNIEILKQYKLTCAEDAADDGAE